MHETEGAARGLRYIYRLFDTEITQVATPPLEQIIRATEICGYAGLNVTYPYKVEIIEHLDKLSDAAAAVGAVNTVVFRDGKRWGHNTDLWGFAESFRQNMANAKRENALLIGAGGAGAAVAHALVDCGVGTVWITDIDPDKAQALVAQVCVTHGIDKAKIATDVEAAAALADGLVNATPVGMATLPGTPIAACLLQKDMWVADIVYFPLETELLKAARAKGCMTFPGSGMAVFQAVRAFELFTGIRADAKRMEATFNAFDD